MGKSSFHILFSPQGTYQLTEESNLPTQGNQQWASTHSQSSHGRLLLQGFQRLPAEDKLHSKLGTSGDQEPAHPRGGRGGDLHPQPERAARECDGLTLPAENCLDVCHKGINGTELKITIFLLLY